MSHYSDRLIRHHLWQPDTPIVTAKLSSPLQRLATDKGSLTSALIRLGDGDFRVRVLRQVIALPYFHEQRKLVRPLHKAAMIREVELLVKNQAVVFARSIVPLNLVSNGRNGLANLGRTPLGHLLFKDGRIRVSKREFTVLNTNGKSIEARRTPYEYQGSTILVAEFFLPAIHTLLS